MARITSATADRVTTAALFRLVRRCRRLERPVLISDPKCILQAELSSE
jgi:hypothetical protein